MYILVKRNKALYISKCVEGFGMHIYNVCLQNLVNSDLKG